MEAIVFENQIILYWERHSLFKEGMLYQLTVDEKVFFTCKTHFKLMNLVPENNYEIELSLIDSNNNTVEILARKKVKTKKIKEIIDVTKAPYCIMGDGKTINTKRIQQVFDNCNENQQIYFPAGIYLTGALNIHSNTEIYLEKGAIIQGTTEVEDYQPKRWSRFEGIEMMCYSSLLNMGQMDHLSGYNCHDVIIRGEGAISGGGNQLRENIIALEFVLLKDYMTSLGASINECEKADTIPGRVRPRLINISNSENIVISGIKIQNGPSWNVHMIYSNNIITCGCAFYSKGINNGDGWDPDSSTNCTIFDCDFYTGDDAVAIKSGKNPEGNLINRPCKYIEIFDCRIHSGCGIAMGSEMSGGIENVSIWDCQMENSLYGIEIKATKKRGGYVRNVKVFNCIVPRIMAHSVKYNDDGITSGVIPKFEDFHFEDITIKRSKIVDYPHKLIELCGFDNEDYALQNVLLKNINMYSLEKDEEDVIDIAYSKDVILDNVTLNKIVD